MSREIKFRAWDTRREMIIDDVYFFELNHNSEVEDDERDRTKYRLYDDWRCLEDGRWQPCELMQFTGLKDKNGTDIYEGDIIQLYRHDDHEHRHIKARVWVNGVYKDDIKEVKFMFGSFVIWSELIKDYRCFANLARPGESLEVIGNRFQNPGLL